jgi:serine/threonine protein kinase
MVAIQALDRLEYIHSKNYIHRDIKPNNFLIGKKNDEIIYLIDFGFARKYRSSKTGKHIKHKFINCVSGSLLYLSLNGIKGYEQSRKDDLESLGYMILFLSLGSLPWLPIHDEGYKFYN